MLFPLFRLNIPFQLANWLPRIYYYGSIKLAMKPVISIVLALRMHVTTVGARRREEWRKMEGGGGG